MARARWFKGKPPHCGWWPASVIRDIDQWRWWDGKTWSLASPSTASAEAAAYNARIPAHKLVRSSIEYSDYYPTDARVSREGEP